MATLPAFKPHENIDDAFAVIASHRVGSVIDFDRPTEWHPHETYIVVSIDANGKKVLCFCERELDVLPCADQVCPVYHRIVVDSEKALDSILNINNWRTSGPPIVKSIMDAAFDRLSKIINTGAGEMYIPALSQSGSAQALRVLAKSARNV